MLFFYRSERGDLPRFFGPYGRIRSVAHNIADLDDIMPSALPILPKPFNCGDATTTERPIRPEHPERRRPHRRLSRTSASRPRPDERDRSKKSQ